MKPQKIIAKCRRGFTVQIPCNWNVKGNCGADTHSCNLIEIVAVD